MAGRKHNVTLEEALLHELDEYTAELEKLAYEAGERAASQGRVKEG
jgi:hypothetical protein